LDFLGEGRAGVLPTGVVEMDEVGWGGFSPANPAE
jgi:hypothetical protein